MSTALPDDKTLLELEQKFDPEMRFRPLTARVRPPSSARC